jgi:uncharacterized membrane protein YkgB
MPHPTLNAYLTETRLAQTQEIVASITALGHRVLRYGLALVIGWIGKLKFTGYEALSKREYHDKSPDYFR